jgi:DNA-binding CsgD family transcriptional regulator
MLSKTKNGYGLGSYEGIPGEKINERKITLREITVALCRLKGLSQIEAAHQMDCSKSNVNQLWQSLFFKTHTNDALAAVIKLIDLGIVKHLILCLLILSSGAQSINPFNDSDINRQPRGRQVRTRSGNRSKFLNQSPA